MRFDLTEIIRAWHWLPKDRTLTNGDGRKPKTGIWLSHTGPLVICDRGLHASIKLLHSLDYAPGPVLCRVEVGGNVIHQSDKLVAEKRKIIWSVCLERVLREWGCLCAERSLDIVESKGYQVDLRSRHAIAVSRLFAAGKATLEELWAAVSAAKWAAKWAADSAAKWAAEEAANRSAGKAAKWAAKWAAVSAAKWAAEWAAYDEERKWQHEQLCLMIRPLVPAKHRDEEWL